MFGNTERSTDSGMDTRSGYLAGFRLRLRRYGELGGRAPLPFRIQLSH